jgi:hypothetical protein
MMPITEFCSPSPGFPAACGNEMEIPLQRGSGEASLLTKQIRPPFAGPQYLCEIWIKWYTKENSTEVRQ